MRAFASWSGGKDCMLAVHRFLSIPGNKVEYLINMCSNDGVYSRSHGIKKQLIKAQSECMKIPIIQPTTDSKEYANNFKKAIVELKEKGITTGVFGDIYLKEHRVWIEKLCEELNIKPIFPLWENDTKDLLKEFISEGFKTIVVAIDNTKLSTQWLGRTIDNDFLNDIVKLEHIDACAEKGEYHSFVYDGPLFKRPISFIKGNKYTESKNTYLELICN